MLSDLFDDVGILLCNNFYGNGVIVIHNSKKLVACTFVDNYLAEVIFRPPLVILKIGDYGKVRLGKAQVGVCLFKLFLKLLHLFSWLFDVFVEDDPQVLISLEKQFEKVFPWSTDDLKARHLNFPVSLPDAIFTNISTNRNRGRAEEVF
jgi:hypothetical protein